MSDRSPLWWLKGSSSEAVWSHLRALERRHQSRIWRDFVNERLYGANISIDGPRGATLMDTMRSVGFTSADLNYVRTIVDALTARIGNNRPAIKFAADGANWKQRRQAKQLDQIIEGEMECLNIEEKAPLALRDCLTVRGGVIKVVPDQGRIVADRTPCEELFYDDREGRYGEPRQLHHVKLVAKEVLAEKFPDARQLIMDAPAPPTKPWDPDQGGRDYSMVEVAESWHLRSGPKAKDGLRMVSIKGKELEREKYERDHFPFAILRWSPPRRGFWGSSLVDELAALQFKVNEVARDLQQNIYFTSAVKVLTRRGADVAKKHVSGKKPHFIEVDGLGSDIVWNAPDGFSMAQFKFLQWLIQQMYEVSGVSQLMAQSKNPLGASASGAALSEFYDIESERFSQLEQAYARFWRDIGRLIVEAAQDLSEDEEFRESEVKWSKQSVLHRVAWKDVDLDADRFELHLEPTGYLPQTRAGKKQAIEQLTAGGMLDPEEAVALMDFPDLKQANMVRTASREWIIWAVGQLEECELDEDDEVIADKSAPIPAPDSHMNLAKAIEMAKAAYQLKATEKTPESVLRRYLTFMELCDAELKKAATATPAPAAGAATMTEPPMPGAMDMAGGPPPMDPMAAEAPMLPPDMAAMPMGVA